MALTSEQVKRRRGERGNVMIMTAILAVGLVLAVGLCIDGARIYMTRAELQNAADAAALAAARELNGGTGGISDAVTAAQNVALEANKYGLNRTGGNAPAVTISSVEFAPALNGPWDIAANIDATEAKTINYVRVTTLISVTPVLFGVKALGNNHSESRTATAGYSAPINTICDFFPIAVALDPAKNVADGDDPNCNTLPCYPMPNTTMLLTFNQGTGSGAVLANKDYVILELEVITGNGSPESVALAGGLANICQTLNTTIPFHMTPSANPNNGPKQIAKGTDTRFDECVTGSPCDINGAGPSLDPVAFPSDTNVFGAVGGNITFDQYDNRTAGFVTPPPNHPPGEDSQRRILIVPVVDPGTYNPPQAIVKKWAAFFLKAKPIVNSPCSKDDANGQNTCAQFYVEWIDEKIILGRGGYDPNAGCTTFSVPVLYQ